MAQHHEQAIPERIDDGVYYDMADAAFCRITTVSAGDGSGDVLPALVTPDGDDIYHVYNDPADFDPDEFIRIKDEAIEDPAQYLNELIEYCFSRSHLDVHDALASEWAYYQTEIVEVDE